MFKLVRGFGLNMSQPWQRLTFGRNQSEWLHVKCARASRWWPLDMFVGL